MPAREVHPEAPQRPRRYLFRYSKHQHSGGPCGLAIFAQRLGAPASGPTTTSLRSLRSGPVTWAVAILLSVLVAAVVLGAICVLVVVLLLKPHAPYVAVQAADLQTLTLGYDQVGLRLDVQVSLYLEARNGNDHSAANFSRVQCRLRFAGATLAVLRADGPFGVPARGTVPLPFVASAQGVPLGDAGSATMEAAVRDGIVGFGLEGEARTRWEVAGLVYSNKWTRLACEIQFVVSNGTALPFNCTSKSKFLFF